MTIPRMKTKIFHMMILILFVLPVFAQASVPRELMALNVIKSTEPNLTQILEEFFRIEKLDGQDLGAWRKKMKAAPYLPTLYVGYDHQIKKAESLSINDNISVSGGTITIGPEDNDYDLNNNSGTVMRLRAVWGLDEIILSSQTAAWTNARRDSTRLRASLGEDVSKIYEERYLYLAQYLAAKADAPTKVNLYYTKFIVLTDRLNALTANRFADLFWREK